MGDGGGESLIVAVSLLVDQWDLWGTSNSLTSGVWLYYYDRVLSILSESYPVIHSVYYVYMKTRR